MKSIVKTSFDKDADISIIRLSIQIKCDAPSHTAAEKTLVNMTCVDYQQSKACGHTDYERSELQRERK